MSSLWPSRAANDVTDGSKGPVDVTDIGVTAESTTSANAAPPVRPGLQRNSSAPNPPSQPPQPPGNQPPDSLSLAQLRRIVSEFPRSEAVAYDFVYTDTGRHAEEIDEWFVYQFWQWVRLNATQRAFESQWNQEMGSMDECAVWDDASEDLKSKFIRCLLDRVKSKELGTRVPAVGGLVYLVLGRWTDTAGGLTFGDRSKLRTVATSAQLDAMRSGIQLIAELDGLPIIWTAFQDALDAIWSLDAARTPPEGLMELQDELMNLMTILYMTMQETINDRKGMGSVHKKLLQLDPNIASYVLTVVAKMRWLEGSPISLTQTLLFLWKCLLVVFGGTEEIEETKKALRETSVDDKEKDIITASPLDYHVFRQEISSKYPAYVPPQLPIPLEANSNTLLPPLPNHPTRNNGSNGIFPAPPNVQSGGASILHQPVHIATPAPSPPPSPGVGGKGGKKQNYQTNQNFPFMYPPLDSTSNSAGGKGGAGLQDLLVGRKWEGSDIPASILEAGELFSKRVRMTRATRQLFEERERFLKFERGWDPTDDDLESLDLDALALDDDDSVDDDKLLAAIEKREKKTQEPKIDYGLNADKLDDELKRRLEAVEKIYEDNLPHLQSVVMVLMKALLYNVTACITLPQPRPNEGLPGNRMSQNGPGLYRSQESSVGVNGSGNHDSPEMTLEDLDQLRAREIESKALTGIILLLLKWFKISHILKFEYITQLLLDSNYLPLVLKLFAHQDVQQVVDSRTDRIEHSFFQFCNLRSRSGQKPPLEPTEIDGPDDESEDEAAPPPIKRRRSPTRFIPAAETNGEPANKQENQGPVRPEVDELGYPINPLPTEPITDFSQRNFFSLINYLRILQKICKNKGHRNLLLVQYKSSNIIRKSLKVPQPELRLYTLKLFKNQVPYCGRKWRQSNMRVITAVYLHCRPELRDEWLAGSDVDAEVEEALPLEQALRSLTHWFNVRRYPDKTAAEVREALLEEQDFFRRELEKLESSWVDAGAAEGGAGEWDHLVGGMADMGRLIPKGG